MFCAVAVMFCNHDLYNLLKFKDFKHIFQRPFLPKILLIKNDFQDTPDNLPHLFLL